MKQISFFYLIVLSFFCLFIVSCDSTSPSSNPSFLPSGMRYIESSAKSFIIGNDEDGDPPSSPEHQVSFTYNYWIDTTEVTQADYLSLMQVNPSETIGDMLPVENVTWYDAVLYCNARSKRDGLDTVYAYSSLTGIPGNGGEIAGLTAYYERKGYRLPTEAEWEYAAAAGTSTFTYWGHYDDSVSPLYAWAGYDQEAATMNQNEIQPVAGLLPNAFGLYDMIGNVREWCTDWYSEYTESAVTDPFGPIDGTTKVQRNAGVNSLPNYMRTAYRRDEPPNSYFKKSGFRVVLPK